MNGVASLTGEKYDLRRSTSPGKTDRPGDLAPSINGLLSSYAYTSVTIDPNDDPGRIRGSKEHRIVANKT